MTTLLLIRHGESEANRNNIFAGQIDPPLQQRGVKQAELTAKYIMDNYKLDRIYSSDLQRAYNTAMCLSKLSGLDVIKDKGLREMDAGEWEGMLFDELPVRYPGEFGVWMEDIGKAACPGGETVSELSKRVMNTLLKIAMENEGKTVAVATHATPVRVAQSIIETGTIDRMNDFAWVSNASVTVLVYDGTWKVVRASIDEHLDELKTILPDNV